MHIKYKIYFTVTCRKCGKEEEFNFLPEELENIEVDAHEQIENEGWIDSVCPRCVKLEYIYEN